MTTVAAADSDSVLEVAEQFLGISIAKLYLRKARNCRFFARTLQNLSAVRQADMFIHEWERGRQGQFDELLYAVIEALKLLPRVPADRHLADVLLTATSLNDEEVVCNVYEQACLYDIAERASDKQAEIHDFHKRFHRFPDLDVVSRRCAYTFRSPVHSKMKWKSTTPDRQHHLGMCRAARQKQSELSNPSGPLLRRAGQ